MRLLPVYFVANFCVVTFPELLERDIVQDRLFFNFTELLFQSFSRSAQQHEGWGHLRGLSLFFFFVVLLVTLTAFTQFLPGSDPGIGSGWSILGSSQCPDGSSSSYFTVDLRAHPCWIGQNPPTSAAFSASPMALPSQYLLAIMGIFCPQMW